MPTVAMYYDDDDDVGQDHLRGFWELSDAFVVPFHP